VPVQDLLVNLVFRETRVARVSLVFLGRLVCLAYRVTLVPQDCLALLATLVNLVLLDCQEFKAFRVYRVSLLLPLS